MKQHSTDFELEMLETVRRADLDAGTARKVAEQAIAGIKELKERSQGPDILVEIIERRTTFKIPRDRVVCSLLSASVANSLIARGTERGFVTYDDLNIALPPEKVSPEQIEDTITMLLELGIKIIESNDL